MFREGASIFWWRVDEGERMERNLIPRCSHPQDDMSDVMVHHISSTLTATWRHQAEMSAGRMSMFLIHYKYNSDCKEIKEHQFVEAPPTWFIEGRHIITPPTRETKTGVFIWQEFMMLSPRFEDAAELWSSWLKEDSGVFMMEISARHTNAAMRYRNRTWLMRAHKHTQADIITSSIGDNENISKHEHRLNTRAGKQQEM